MKSTRNSCHIFLEVKYSQQIFEEKKNTKISNFTKIRSVGAQLFHADGRMTDGQTLRNYLSQ